MAIARIQKLRIHAANPTAAFENKQALFIRALRLYSETRLEYLTDLFSASGPIGPRLKAAMTVFAGVGEHRRGCVMVNAAAELGAADDDVKRIAHDLFKQIEDVFRQATMRAGRRALVRLML